MPFRCPQCRLRNSLEITEAIELPPDSRSDEITLQVVECRNCQFNGLAIYSESRRGPLDKEAWEHRGYKTDLEIVNQIRMAIQACPQPKVQTCPCETHQQYGRRDKHGRWNAMEDFHPQNSFEMRFSI